MQTHPTSIPVTAAFSLISTLVDKLGPLAVEAWYLRDAFEQIKKDMIGIKAVILDAEEQQKRTNSHEIRHWLETLYDALYEAEDLVDDFSTEDLARQVMTKDKKGKQFHIFFSSSNKIGFNLKKFPKVRKVVKIFADLNLGKRVFNFTTNIPNKLAMNRRDTLAFISEERVVGRDDIKNELLRLVKRHISNEEEIVNDEDNFSVISIVGIGGLGKTALAQLVFSDRTIEDHFEFRKWVCVADDVSGFDDKVIAEKIAECDANLEKDLVFQKLDEKIRGKRCLLVLDDLWNEQDEPLFHLKSFLVNAGKGSKIIVTTRSATVAKVTGACSSSTFFLKGLDENQSWSLFCRHAFGGVGNAPENPEIVLIGKDIVNKCAGVPLAIRVVGAFMRYMKNERDWSNVKNKDLVKIDEQGPNVIFQLIKLSYNHLPFHLKNCFAYCSLFEKDCVIDKMMLIRLWIAQGFILAPTDESKSLEDEAEEYLMTLLNRSFFQDVKRSKKGNIYSFKMHDLIHDLATSISNNEYVMIDPTKQTHPKIEKQTHHISFPKQISSSSSSWRDPSSLLVADKLRTFLAPSCHGDHGDQFDEAACKLIMSNFKRLRVLTLHHLTTRNLHSYIGKLKHLTYLDISFSKTIEVLPSCITTLYNLETLLLNGCSKLREWPKDIWKLISLRHLEFIGCHELTSMPLGIGKLTILQTLSEFVIGRDSELGGRGSELGKLNNLRRSLTISRMDCLRRSPTEVKSMNLMGKSHIKRLQLDWTFIDDSCYIDGFEKDDLILQDICLHPNTKKLVIRGFSGVEISSSVNLFSNLNKLILSYGHRLQYLPLSVLNVKSLWLKQMHCIQWIVNCNNNCISSSTFSPSIEKINLWALKNLKGWCACSDEAVAQGCHPFKLDSLYIQSCPKLISFPQQSKVRKLELNDVGLKLLEEVSNHIEVEILVMRYC